MATLSNNNLYKGIPKLKDAFVIIVKTEWNAHLVNQLEKGAIAVFKNHGILYKTLVVPGAVEIPFAVQQHYKNQPADAYIVLGTVVKGETPHFDYVCKSVTEGITQLNLIQDAPVIFGVLTVNNEQEAKERIGGKHGHKGEEAAVAAIKMIALKRKIAKK